jgi:hypothetical protein
MHLNDFYEFGSIEPNSKKHRNIEKFRFGWFDRTNSNEFDSVRYSRKVLEFHRKLLKTFLLYIFKQFNLKDLYYEIEMPKIKEFDSSLYIERKKYMEEIKKAFNSDQILILNGCGKKIFAQQYAQSFEKENGAVFWFDKVDSILIIDGKKLNRFLTKEKSDKITKYLFIFNEDDLYEYRRQKFKDFIRKISNNHKYVYFLLISNNDSLKDHFITKSIELKFFEKKESEELIKKCIISEFKDMTEDDLESVLNDLFEFRNAEFKTETDPKDLKKIIDIINNENNDEWSDKADDIKKLKGINIIKDEMY